MSRMQQPPSQRDNRRPAETPPKPQPASPGRSRWEYCVVQTDYYGSDLAALGRDGWEAVGVVSSLCDAFTLLMKRQLL